MPKIDNPGAEILDGPEQATATPDGRIRNRSEVRRGTDIKDQTWY
jgi:hypothetical protein